MSKEKNAQAIVDKYGKNYPITINEVKKNRYQVFFQNKNHAFYKLPQYT